MINETILVDALPYIDQGYEDAQIKQTVSFLKLIIIFFKYS
jgi:hypothetical protein